MFKATTTKNLFVRDPVTGEVRYERVQVPRGSVAFVRPPCKPLAKRTLSPLRVTAEVIDLTLSPDVVRIAASPRRPVSPRVQQLLAQGAAIDTISAIPFLSPSRILEAEVPEPETVGADKSSRTVAASDPYGYFHDECKVLRNAARAARERAIVPPLPPIRRALTPPPKYTPDELPGIKKYIPPDDTVGFGPFPYVPEKYNLIAHRQLSVVIQRDNQWMSCARAVSVYGISRDVIISAAVNHMLPCRRELRGGLGFDRLVWVYQHAGLITLAMAKYKSHFGLARRNFENEKNKATNFAKNVHKLVGSRRIHAELKIYLST